MAGGDSMRILIQARRPSRIVSEAGLWQLRAGRRGTGRLVAERDWAEPGALDTLREAAATAGLYVWAVDPPRTHNPMARLILGGV